MTINHNIAFQIRDFLSRNVLFREDFPYGDEMSLLEEGIIDSMGVLELMMFVQSTFSIVVDPLEVTRDNFDSVSKLEAYIRGKITEQLGIKNVGTAIFGE